MSSLSFGSSRPALNTSAIGSPSLYPLSLRPATNGIHWSQLEADSDTIRHPLGVSDDDRIPVRNFLASSMSTSAKEGPVNGRRRYDPRLGDEDDATPNPRHVRIPDDVPHPSDDGEKPPKPRPATSPNISLATRVAKLLPLDLSWIRPNLTWSKLKPVIRCAVVCWVSALLMIIGPTGRAFGMVSPHVQDLYATSGREGRGPLIALRIKRTVARHTTLAVPLLHDREGSVFSR